MLTYSLSIFKVIVKSTITTEKRILIDIRAAREAYERWEICDVGWFLSEDNIADLMTKLSP